MLLNACSTLSPIKSVDAQNIPEGLTTQQVKKSVILAGQSRGWIMMPVSEGVMNATYTARGHMAKVQIDYSTQFYSISYKDSSNLNLKGNMINRHYNKWIDNLNISIQRQLSKMAISNDN